MKNNEINEIADNTHAYQQAYYPPVPNRFTRFMRTCAIWQFFRFIAINIKMLQVVSKSH